MSLDEVVIGKAESIADYLYSQNEEKNKQIVCFI